MLSKADSTFDVGDCIRMPHYQTVEKGRYRVWLVVAVKLGGLNQESTYELRACDILDNDTIHIPCIILETHPLIERYRVDQWT